MFWSLGHVITSGAFLHYFIYDLDIGFKEISIVIALPELVGFVAIFTRVLLNWNLGLKKIWLNLLFASRILAIGIPLLIYLDDDSHHSSSLVRMLLLFLAVSEMLQAFSYTAYISWLSVLSPRTRWGEMFAYRNIAKLVVMIIWATSVAYARDYLNHHYSPEQLELFYVICFLSGCLLQLCSVLPLLKLPESEVQDKVSQFSWGKLFAVLMQDSSLRWLMMHSWTLAFFNGLTQSVFFFYSRNVLELSLTYSFLLLGIMRVVKLPVSYLTGKACDRGYDKATLWGGLLLANMGLLFWFPATIEQPWWLVLCYFLWGFYAAANIGGQNLLLKHAPTSDNTLQLALFQRMAGTLAGLSGLLGGYLLTLKGPIPFTDIYIHDSVITLGNFSMNFTKYHVIILISLVGRYLALLFLFPVLRIPNLIQHQFGPSSLSSTCFRLGLTAFFPPDIMTRLQAT
ncbi:MAG: MFS transporter [Planctomycetaceae bacterium]